MEDWFSQNFSAPSFPLYRNPGTLEASLPFLEGALAFSFVVYFFETYLDFRQHQRFSDKEIPAELSATVRDLDEVRSYFI